MTTDITFQKPKKLSSAIKLLMIYIVLGIFGTIIFQITTAIPDPIGMTLINTIFGFAFAIFLIYHINEGKKWARTVFLVFFIFDALLFPFRVNTLSLFETNLFSGILSILLLILQLISLIMLYSKECNEWFKKKLAIKKQLEVATAKEWDDLKAELDEANEKLAELETPEEPNE